MPEPPLNPDPPVPGLVEIMEVGTGPISLVGSPGAVMAGERVFVLHLDGVSDGEFIEANADGSFSLEGNPGGVYRLEVVDAEGRRSEPLDLDRDGPVSIELPCLQIPSQFDSPGMLQVQNDCADEVRVRAAMRRDGVFSVAPDEATLASGEARTFELTGDGPEDALFFFVDAPLTERRAVTLY